jgi:hypothetical protein
MNQVVLDPVKMVVEVNVEPPVQVVVERPQAVVVAVAEQGPRGAKGDTGVANTWVLAGDGIEGGGLLVSNVTVAVDATVVRTSGDQLIDGTKQFGSVVFIDAANSKVGINTQDPRIDLQIGDVGLGTYASSITTSFANQIIDQWSALDFRSAKYQVQIHAQDEDEFEISEIFLLHNGGEVYMTEYAIVNQGIRLAQFGASIFNNTVRLLCTPTYSMNEIKVFRTVITR